MQTMKLDPQLPERMQLERLGQAMRMYRRLVPHLSELAEKAFVRSAEARRLALEGPSHVLVPTAEDGLAPPPPGDPDEPPCGTVVPNLDPDQAGLCSFAGTAWIGPLDPRSPEFGGRASRLAERIGHLLAVSVLEQIASREATGARFLKRRSEVQIFGEIPVHLRAGGTGAGPGELTAENPLLKGRVDILLSPR